MWLINVHNGIKEQGINPINIDDYPTIKNHLDKYFSELEKRQDKGDSPYNLRNCAYMEDFFRPKIIFQEMVQEPSFMIDESNNFMCLDTGRIIVGENLIFLLAILNSKLFFYAIKNFYGGGSLGESGVRMKHPFFEKFNCVVPSVKQKEIIEMLTKQRIKLKENSFSTEEIEKKIDKLIYSLYKINSHEMITIEGQNLQLFQFRH